MVDLVCGAGAEKSGRLVVLEQSLRPQLNVAFEVPGCEALWALRQKDSDFHKYLVLSRADATMVLESGAHPSSFGSHPPSHCFFL